MPIFYECRRCTACCRWPGQVRLDDSEITRLASFLQLSEHDFIQRYTRLTHDRRGLALQDKPNGECILLDCNDCSVEAVKPRQCREFSEPLELSRLLTILPRHSTRSHSGATPATAGKTRRFVLPVL